MYSETEEVAKILMEMLDDLATRLSVIDEVDEQAKKMVDDAYAKMLEWEKKLVVLANGEARAFAHCRVPFSARGTRRLASWMGSRRVLRLRWNARGECSALGGTHGGEIGGAERWWDEHHQTCAARSKGAGAVDY